MDQIGGKHRSGSVSACNAQQPPDPTDSDASQNGETPEAGIHLEQNRLQSAATCGKSWLADTKLSSTASFKGFGSL